MGFPNKEKDMDDIVNAFSKIINNLENLRGCDIDNVELNIGR